jgi:hypothetical protein
VSSAVNSECSHKNSIQWSRWMQEKGDGANLCEAPSGPFRQISPVPVFLAMLAQLRSAIEARSPSFCRDR